MGVKINHLRDVAATRNGSRVSRRTCPRSKKIKEINIGKLKDEAPTAWSKNQQYFRNKKALGAIELSRVEICRIRVVSAHYISIMEWS